MATMLGFGPIAAEVCGSYRRKLKKTRLTTCAHKKPFCQKKKTAKKNGMDQTDFGPMVAEVYELD